MTRTNPSYVGLRPASPRATAAARGSSKKTNTSCEVLLRRALWHRGLRFRKNVRNLPGKPDIVFTRARLVIFCDGDFWHGKNWDTRRKKLTHGTNAQYWVAKIERNVQRDREHDRALASMGWVVLRVWESEVHKGFDSVVVRVEQMVRASIGH
jgi:DNA mismatch endonuclease (patch repair protein)